MIGNLGQKLHDLRLWRWAVAAAVLLGAAYLGARPSPLWLALPVLGAGLALLLQQPLLGLLALVPAALVLPISVGTGTAVEINPATLLVPAMLAVGALDMLRRREVRLAPSRTTRPLALFLAAGLLSLMIGNTFWDPAVPRSGSFTLVQLAQWAIFLFSAGAFWLTGNLVGDETWLRRITYVFLCLAGSLAVLRIVPQSGPIVAKVATFAINRAPFWMLLAAVAGGQLLFNHDLDARWRWLLAAVLGAVVAYAFILERETISNWAGVAAVAGALAWLRLPRLRWLALLVIVALAVTGVLSSVIYEFAGGDDEWTLSGGSRLALIRRVIELTMRNPVTGLGPAAYRQYGKTGSLSYHGVFYRYVWLSSHNNYVDLFSQGGLLGLGLFAWFAVELIRLGLRLRVRFREGFAGGYVNGMLAAWAGALVLMLFADWILPFVYNIGFLGFQASVLVWLFLGGLVTLEQVDKSEPHEQRDESALTAAVEHDPTEKTRVA